MRALPRLIDAIHAMGFECTGGELYRTPTEAALNAQQGDGIAHSLHTLRLAIDLQLFRDGEYLTDSSAYASVGAFWKSQGPEYAWGGDFHKPDGNHFSIAHDGVR